MSEHRIDETRCYEEDFATRNFNKVMDGKAVTITGVSYDMGKKMAQLVVEQRTKVSVTARGKEKLDAAITDIKEKIGGDITGVTAGSSKPEECRKVFEKTLEAYGDIDVLINNVDKGELITIDAVSGEVIDQVVDTNMERPLHLRCEAVRYFLKKDSGDIISIPFVNGTRPMCDAAYRATKDGLSIPTKNATIRCIGTGVRYNTATPGHTPSPTAYAHDDGGSQTPVEGVMNEVRNTRTAHSVHPWEIDQAYAVLFLANDMSCCINGEVLSVDYGCYL